MNRHAPSDELLSELDKEMKHILLSKEPESIKIKLYNQVLNKRNLMHTFNQPEGSAPDIDIKKIKMEESPRKVVVEIPEPSTSDFVEDMVLETVPKNMKRYAQNILKVFKANPEIVPWTPKGEFIYLGQPVKNSNIVDLVDSMLRTGNIKKGECPRFTSVC